VARYSRPTRLADLTHRFLGPHGSPRRRRVLALPLLGPALGVGSRTHWGIRRLVERKQLDVERTYTDFKNRHARTAPNLTRKNTRRAYNRVYGDDRLLGEYLVPERVVFYREIAEVARGFGAGSVIDVGCGTGGLLRELVELTPYERVVGIDFAEAGIRRAAELVPAGEFHGASLYDLDLAETFDLVVCTEVLEHLADPEAAVERLVDLCAEGGAIVVTVPDGASDTWQGHLNFWGRPELEEFLGRYGDVEVRRIRGDLLAVLRP
jgi:SAM-dependent methyltransferase